MKNIPFSSILSSLLIPLLLVPVLAAPGCFLVVAAAGATAGAFYVQGELKAEVDGHPKEVGVAAKRALSDLDIMIIEETVTQLDATVYGALADEEVKIAIETSEHNPNRCEVRIRVGVFGDEAKSSRILEKMRGHLEE